MITLEFGGDHPLTIPCLTLDGYHRPLGGESASLTLTVAPAALLTGWLAQPPLGMGCTVRYDQEVVMDGALHGVRVNSKGVELRVEG